MVHGVLRALYKEKMRVKCSRKILYERQVSCLVAEVGLDQYQTEQCSALYRARLDEKRRENYQLQRLIEAQDHETERKKGNDPILHALVVHMKDGSGIIM